MVSWNEMANGMDFPSVVDIDSSDPSTFVAISFLFVCLYFELVNLVCVLNSTEMFELQDDVIHLICMFPVIVILFFCPSASSGNEDCYLCEQLH